MPSSIICLQQQGLLCLLPLNHTPRTVCSCREVLGSLYAGGGRQHCASRMAASVQLPTAHPVCLGFAVCSADGLSISVACCGNTPLQHPAPPECFSLQTELCVSALSQQCCLLLFPVLRQCFQDGHFLPVLQQILLLRDTERHWGLSRDSSLQGGCQSCSAVPPG